MRWYLTVTHISHCEINSVTANYYAAYKFISTRNLSILLVNKWNNQMRHDQTIGTTSFMGKWYEVGTTTMCFKSWGAWTKYWKYGTRNISILLVNTWSNQMILDQTNGTTSFMVKWYEVEITTMCYISWEACKNTENKLFCFQNIGPNIWWSKK